MNTEKHILFYDGDCGLCSKSVQYLQLVDKKEKLCFLPLDSQESKSILQPFKLPTDLDSVLLLSNEKIFVKSEAILTGMRIAGFSAFTISLLRAFPLFIRDYIYDLVAKYRKHFHAKTCNIN